MSFSSLGVSYVLLHKNKWYPFAGYPDFVAFKDDYGALRIPICTGEVQSTSDLDMQNSIYAVDSLLKHCAPEDNSPIIYLTVFKRKYCTLAIARLSREKCKPNTIGTVSQKYFISPSPIDLLNDLKTFASRLYTLLKAQIFRSVV